MSNSSESDSTQKTSGGESLSMIKDARKRDALALAYLIYDIYREDLVSSKIVSGQNNVQSSQN